MPPSVMSTGGGEDEAPMLLRMRVPIAVENADQATERQEIADRLMIPVEMVPSARRDDTDLEIEWTLTNAGTMNVDATLQVNAANELFAYDPAALVVEDEEDRPPALAGGRPISVPAGKSVSGTIREDELYEAAQDLDAMTRGGVGYGFALFTRWKTRDVTSVDGEMVLLRSEIVPLLLELQMGVESSQPLTLTARLRVRDQSDRLRPNATEATPLVPPSATTYVPPDPEMAN